jgi:hypothetical protein
VRAFGLPITCYSPFWGCNPVGSQEPYLLQNKTAGITRTHRIYISNEDKSWAAIIIANDNIDAVLLKQLSDRDNVALELRYKSIRLLAASMYLDISEEIDKQTAKVGEQYSKGSGILIAMDAIPGQRYGTTIIQTPEAKRWKNI